MAEIAKQGITVCVDGKNYRAHIFYYANGQASANSYYLDQAGSKIPLLGSNWYDGECPVIQPVTALPNQVLESSICDNGFTRPYNRTTDNAGTVIREQYRNSAGAWINLPGVLPATMKFGVCPYQAHAKALPGVTLVTGNNTITHNLNLAVVKAGVIVRDATTGQEITVRAITFTANTFIIPWTLASTLVDIMVVGEG